MILRWAGIFRKLLFIHEMFFEPTQLCFEKKSFLKKSLLSSHDDWISLNKNYCSFPLTSKYFVIMKQARCIIVLYFDAFSPSTPNGFDACLFRCNMQYVLWAKCKSEGETSTWESTWRLSGKSRLTSIQLVNHATCYHLKTLKITETL